MYVNTVTLYVSLVYWNMNFRQNSNKYALLRSKFRFMGSK